MDWGARDRDDAALVLKRGGDPVMMTYPTAQGANTNGFHFQMKDSRWQDVRVRRAFSLGIDRREFDLARYFGEGGGYSKGPIPWQALYPQMPTLLSQGPWYQYDPKQASQLLLAAGYSAARPAVADAPVWFARDDYGATGFNGILAPMYDHIAELKFNARQVDITTAFQMLNDRSFRDTMNVTWGPPAYSVDQAVYSWYHSKGANNHASVNDAEMDRLLAAQRREQNPERQKELWTQIEKRYFDQVWQVFFPTAMVARGLFHNYLVNYRFHGFGGFTCYANGQARAVWLDEGAPNVLELPEFRDLAEV